MEKIIMDPNDPDYYANVDDLLDSAEEEEVVVKARTEEELEAEVVAARRHEEWCRGHLRRLRVQRGNIKRQLHAALAQLIVAQGPEFPEGFSDQLASLCLLMEGRLIALVAEIAKGAEWLGSAMSKVRELTDELKKY